MSNEKYLGNQNLKQAGSVSVGKSGGTTAYDEFLDGSSVGVSSAGTARVRYNDSTKVLEKSIDGGAWETLGGGGESRPIKTISDLTLKKLLDDKPSVLAISDGSQVAVTP